MSTLHVITQLVWGLPLLGRLGRLVLVNVILITCPRESGLGIASEWGCGDDGAHCGAGWGAYPDGASNGVLGYEEAAAGGPFLKIGVGALLKGSCTAMHWAPSCKSTDPSDVYHFGSPCEWRGPSNHAKLCPQLESVPKCGLVRNRQIRRGAGVERHASVGRAGDDDPR